MADLFDAARAGDLPAMTLLLEGGADPNARVSHRLRPGWPFCGPAIPYVWYH